MSRHLPIPPYMHHMVICEGETRDPDGYATWTPQRNTADGFVRWLTETFLAQYGVTLGEIVPHPDVFAVVINYRMPFELMDTFSEIVDYVWWIDAASRMNFVPNPKWEEKFS